MIHGSWGYKNNEIAIIVRAPDRYTLHQLIQFFSPQDSTSLGPRTSSGYQEDILEQFEISKMAAEMDAAPTKKLLLNQ